MAFFRGIQEYIALDANNIFLYPPQGHPILYNYFDFPPFLYCPDKMDFEGSFVSLEENFHRLALEKTTTFDKTINITIFLLYRGDS